MAYVRKLASGLWAATVRLPDGRRVTQTRELKPAVVAWAADLEADVRRGDWLDPRAGEVTVGQWWERCRDARHLELASRKRDASHWRVHVAPRWERAPVGAILKPDVSKWVEAMKKAGVGAATIQGSVGVLRGLMDQAVDARLRRDNPAKGVRTPRRPVHADRVLLPAEDEMLLSALDRQFPGRPDGRLFCEQLLYSGLRWEEAAALDRDHVDMRLGLIHVGPVVERDGTIRPYPKTPAGERTVPVDDDVWPRLREHALTMAPHGLLFTTFAGRVSKRKRSGGPGVLSYSNWYDRVWSVALAGTSARAAVKGHAPREAVAGAGLEDPQPTPHDLRHTYGTRLGEQGVPVHEIMYLMGHESLASAQRYLHAGEGRFDRARAAMKKARTS